MRRDIEMVMGSGEKSIEMAMRRLGMSIEMLMEGGERSMGMIIGKGGKAI